MNLEKQLNIKQRYMRLGAASEFKIPTEVLPTSTSSKREELTTKSS